MLLGIVGMLLFLVSVVWLIVSLIRKKGAKKPLIALATGFILFVVGIATDTDSSADENVKSEESTSEPAKKEAKEADVNLERDKEKAEADKKAKAEAKSIAAEEKAKAESIAAEEKANAKAESIAAEEAAEAELKDPATYKSDITYDQIARTPDDYLLEKVKFSGKVVQVMEGDDTTNQLRVAINDNYDTIMLVEYEKDILDSRILEDDYINMFGYSMGVITYESTLGGNITIPAMSANMIEY
ncbi:MAG: hypothetical protein RR408_05425 [Carnobacterium sp.]|uniref:hypothetical protein n=1 Tax=Carnobacterium sp. TaxID=48221 RepID=UPI002FCA50C8